MASGHRLRRGGKARSTRRASGVSDSGDPVRTFECALDRNADRAWSCYMLVEDTLTAHGVDRGEPIIRAESHGDGLTITQARALAAALLEAADTAETI